MEIFSLWNFAFLPVNLEPFNIASAASVPYGDSFILVGGYDVTTMADSDKLYFFDEEGYTFYEMEQTLEVARSDSVSVWPLTIPPGGLCKVPTTTNTNEK
jgi:hypothetical protein